MNRPLVPQHFGFIPTGGKGQFGKGWGVFSPQRLVGPRPAPLPAPLAKPRALIAEIPGEKRIFWWKLRAEGCRGSHSAGVTRAAQPLGWRGTQHKTPAPLAQVRTQIHGFAPCTLCPPTYPCVPAGVPAPAALHQRCEPPASPEPPPASLPQPPRTPKATL